MRISISHHRPPASRTAAGRRPLRGAFTLLEVLTALGLSVILATAIYAAIDIFLRVSRGDEGELERSRLTRALLRQMTTDLQSVVFRVIEPETSSDGSETGAEASGTATGDSSNAAAGNEAGTTFGSLDSLGAEMALQTTSVGLIGDSRKLTVHISRPARDMNYQPVLAAADPGVRTSDLQSITYFLATASGSGLEGAVGQQSLVGNLSAQTTTGPLGLARLAGDRMAIEYADFEADINTLAMAARIIAPEVVSLQFRYFDGLTWQSEWDSVAAQTLPNAVEITLGLRRLISEEERRANLNNPGQRAGQDDVVITVRHVVALPLATPYTGGI